MWYWYILLKSIVYLEYLCQMHSNSASSPSSNIPMKKKAKVDNIESSANSDTDSLPNNHHAIRHQTSERAQRCSRFSSLDATSASCSNPAEVSNICKRSSQHSDKEMLGGRHSSSVASSLKHSHESSNPSRSHREQNLHLFGSQAYKHGDSESPGLAINGHSSCRFSLDSKCSSRRSSGSQSPYVHGKSNNDDRCKYGTLGSSSNEVNKNLEVTNIGRASLRKSSLPCTTGHHSTKQPTSDLGRGEGTVNRYVRELEQRVRWLFSIRRGTHLNTSRILNASRPRPSWNFISLGDYLCCLIALENSWLLTCHWQTNLAWYV